MHHHQLGKDIWTVKSEDYKENKSHVLSELAQAMGFKAEPEFFTDRQEQSLGAFSQISACQYFSPGEIETIWQIVRQRAAFMGYQRPVCDGRIPGTHPSRRGVKSDRLADPGRLPGATDP